MARLAQLRDPRALPLEVFGETWKQWLLDAAVAAACPVDYVVAPLLASVSTLIGNARWAQAWPGWNEPPHLWTVVERRVRVIEYHARVWFLRYLPQ